MNIVTDEVHALVAKEYEAAGREHGPLASMHEGYAVLLEELEETEEELTAAFAEAKYLWRQIKTDNDLAAIVSTRRVKTCAVRAACEAIQVAAVCKRIADIDKNRRGAD